MTLGHHATPDRRRAAVLASSFALLLGLLATQPATAEPLSPQETRGREIYMGGGDPSQGLVLAHFGRDSVSMPASLLPCANCHGTDGLGRPEGGAEPSNITWSHLSKSYGHRHRQGRQHPAFDEESLGKAIAEGLDPAGNRLDPIMPRYEMSAEDMSALVAYIKRLESDLSPGLSETTIRLGSLLPSDGPYGEVGRAVDAVLRAYFDEVNTAGGIYGRQIELKVAKYDGAPEPTAANLRHLLEQDKVFAMLDMFALGMERELFAILDDGGVPQVDPVSLFAGHRELQNDSTFFLLSGLSDQARALVDYAALHLELAPSATAVVLADSDIYADVADAVERQGDQRGWPRPTVIRVGAGRDAAARRVEELSRSGAGVVFYFGPTEGLPAFAEEAAKRDWRPRIFLSGLIAGRQALGLPEAFQDRLFLAYPILPRDQSPKGLADFRALHGRHGLPREHLATQVEAYAGAKVLVEAMRRSGRKLSRTALVDALEGLSKFDTGQTLPVSYGANRRVGVLGAYVLAVDLEARRVRPEATWVPLD